MVSWQHLYHGLSKHPAMLLACTAAPEWWGRGLALSTSNWFQSLAVGPPVTEQLQTPGAPLGLGAVCDLI